MARSGRAYLVVLALMVGMLLGVAGVASAAVKDGKPRP